MHAAPLPPACRRRRGRAAGAARGHAGGAVGDACWSGRTDTMVRTVNVDPPPAAPTDEDARPGRGAPAGRHRAAGRGRQPRDDGGGDRSRGVPVRVSGTALPARVLLAYRNAADALQRQRPGLPPALEPGRRRSARSSPGTRTAARSTVAAAPCRRSSGRCSTAAGDVAAITRHRRRAVRRRHHLGPRGGADAVHPVVLGGLGPRRRRRRPQPTRPTSTTRRWRPRRTCAPATATSRDEKDRRSAVFSYNHSWDYVDLVLAWADAYATGTPSDRAGSPVAGDGRRRPVRPRDGAGRRPARRRADRRRRRRRQPGPTPSRPPAGSRRPRRRRRRRARADTDRQPATSPPPAAPGAHQPRRRRAARPRRPTGSPTGTATGRPDRHPDRDADAHRRPTEPDADARPAPTRARHPTAHAPTPTPTGCPTPRRTLSSIPPPRRRRRVADSRARDHLRVPARRRPSPPSPASSWSPPWPAARGESEAVTAQQREQSTRDRRAAEVLRRGRSAPVSSTARPTRSSCRTSGTARC